jgi:hypothetical protein
MIQHGSFCLKEINFFRIQNAAVTVFVAQKWIKVARRAMNIRARRAAAAAADKLLDLE